MNLTQPLEVLSGQQDGESPWFSDVEKMLTDVKTACANIKFLGAIFKEITTILEDGQVGGEYFFHIQFYAPFKIISLI